MKGFTKDGKFRPTEGNHTSAIHASDVITKDEIKFKKRKCHDCGEDLTGKSYYPVKGKTMCAFCGVQYNSKGYSKTRGWIKH